MTSNYTRTGTDLDNILITQANKANVPFAYRKSGANSIWGVFGVGYGWGDDYGAQLGNGQAGDSGYPNYIPISYNTPQQIINVTQWRLVSAGRYRYSAGIKNDGTLWSWGTNTYGYLGLGDTVPKSSPSQIGTQTNWSSVSTPSASMYAIKTDGTLWSWGYNAYGSLGLGDTTNRSSPVQVGTLTNWSKVATGGLSGSIGDSAIAIKTDGTLWSWGYNNYGQLGQNDTVHRSSPVQVGALTTWSQVFAAPGQAMAIKTDGTLWSWGVNNYGQLGDGTTTSRSSPVQVGALTTWSQVSCGFYHSLAIKTDGTLWSWGYNAYGQLGLGDTTNRSSPVQVGALTNWSLISGFYHSLAIKTDGTLWSWGYNGNGELGQGDTTNRSSPVQVGALNTWATISGGYGFSLGIIKQDLTG